MMARERDRLLARILGIWLLILPAAGLWFSLVMAGEPVTMSVFPHVPREDAPLVVASGIANQGASDENISYRFYVDGLLFAEGGSFLTDATSKAFRYVREPSVKIGQRISFALESNAVGQDFERTASLPAYPPEVWSSFVSFATFSTSVMSSLITTTFYSGAFVAPDALNLGLMIVGILLALMIFLELTIWLKYTEASTLAGNIFLTRFVALRVRFGRLALVLFVIFIGMVVTRVGLSFGLITVPSM